MRLPLRQPLAPRSLDEKNLRENVSKDATVLLPDYPVPDLKRELEALGFTKFIETVDSQKHRVSGPKGDLDVMIIALRAPADGPIGDSGLIVSDGETTCFNMNDARPIDLDVVAEEFGHVDIHLLQYSGAIWYPMVYDIPASRKPTSPSRSASAAWTGRGPTSSRSAPRGWCRRPDRRCSSTTTCSSSTTSTPAANPTRRRSSPTRRSSWSR